MTFNTLKLITNSKTKKMTIIEDKNSILIAENNSRIERWTEYCKDHYNY